MPCCAKPAERLLQALRRPGSRVVLLVFSAVLLAACSQGEAGGAFEVKQVEAQWSNGRIAIQYHQQLRLSSEAQNALVHGVPLTFETDIILRDAKTQTRLERNRSRHEIRFLPLSEHYQLSNEDGSDVRTYPRLRHALAALGRADVSFETGALPAGEYELLVRSFLDKNAMPPPMRLPALFSSRWDHQSNWTSWPLQIEPGA